MRVGRYTNPPPPPPNHCLLCACYCLVMISNPRGVGMSLYIMGLSTQDPQAQKEHIKLYKIIKFGVYCANNKGVTEFQSLQHLPELYTVDS